MRAHPAGKLGEGATAVTGAELCERLFRSTPPARGATSYACLINCLDGRFQSTPPARGATPDQNPAKGRVGHFNPRPPRGGRQRWYPTWRSPSYFNPRPPRGGRLRCCSVCRLPVRYFNPRPLRGGRHNFANIVLTHLEFQSTPPARGATHHSKSPNQSDADFNPRPPRGGRPWTRYRKAPFQLISIHAPREGGDSPERIRLMIFWHFNPRPPRGGRQRISALPYMHSYFNPRPPRGGRRAAAPSYTANAQVFQSTPPARGATMMRNGLFHKAGISIHAPREGGDCCGSLSRSRCHYFNPRPPRGGRPNTASALACHWIFQSTPPARGATCIYAIRELLTLFQSTPPARGATLPTIIDDPTF